ncbi:MAG TPA: CAP domain-containing protein [Longimicrobium sp.]|nr:CAP domain-containing protein [Longimicrobium sp.]
MRGVHIIKRGMRGGIAARYAAGVLMLALAACTRPARAADPAPVSEYHTLEWELFQHVSLHRDSLNLARLRFDEDLAALAREHSRAMASGAVPFSHERFEERAAQAVALGYPFLGENLAFNDYAADTTARVALAGLVGSPPHRHTMEGDWERSGVGVARSADGRWFYTQLFARGAPKPRPLHPPRSPVPP